MLLNTALLIKKLNCCLFVFQARLKSTVKVLSGGTVLFVGFSLGFGSEKFYRNVAMPVTQLLLNAETAHRFAVKTASWGLVPRNSYVDPPSLVRSRLRVMNKN